MAKFALDAAEELAGIGIEAEVIDLRSLRPLDTETVIESVKKTNRIVCCEEGWRFFGVGAEIAAAVTEHAFDYLDAPPIRVAQKDVPPPYAANLEKLSLPHAADIVEAAKKVCYRETESMATQITMPALSPTMEEGNLAKWHVKVGDKVKAGDIIAEIETDKATMEVEAVDEGVISKLLVAEGAQGVKVNAVIAELTSESEAPAPKSRTRLYRRRRGRWLRSRRRGLFPKGQSPDRRPPGRHLHLNPRRLSFRSQVPGRSPADRDCGHPPSPNASPGRKALTCSRSRAPAPTVASLRPTS